MQVSQNQDLVLPPCALEAETTVLGGILLGGDGIDLVFSLLEADAFYVNAHKDIYLTAKSLYEANKPINLLTVTQRLTDNGLLESIGGRNKLANLVDCIAVNLDYMCELIMEKYYRRKLMSASAKMREEALDPLTTLEQCIESAERKVFEISQKQCGDRYNLGNAKQMSIELFDDLSSGKMEGDKIGWYDLEHLTGGIHKPMLKVVAAESHMGKTHYMIAQAMGIMKTLQKPVLYITPEMSKKQINTRVLASLTGIDSSEIAGNPERHWDAIVQGIDKLSELPWAVYDHSAPSVQAIASTIRLAIKDFGCPLGGVFIDYLQQIPLENNGNMAVEVGKVTRAIREIARYHEVPIYLGCQINRSNQTSADKRPNRHMLRNSGEIFEVCDQLVMLYRPSVYSKDISDNSIELIVEKNRLTGKVGTATMLCDLRTSSFKNLKR